MAEETVLLHFEVDAGAAETSIESLRKANAALTKERNKVNLSTDEGKKKVQELNIAIDKNNATIKTNVSALDKQRLNVGNYTESINQSVVANLKKKKSIEGLKNSLTTLAPGLSSATSGFYSMAKAALKLIATPIGAVITALVAAFGLLKAAITTNNAVFDKFENVTNAIGVVMDVLLNRVGKFGEALIDLASLNFSGAIDKTKEAFSGIGDEIDRATTAGQLYLDLSRGLEDSQRLLRIETAKETNEITKLVVAAKNRNLTFDEQEALLRRALTLEKALVEQRTELARQDLVIVAKQVSQSKKIYQTNEETFDKFVDRLINGSKLADDEINKIIDKVVDLENARGDSLAFQEKVANQIEAIQIKREAAALKAAQDAEDERLRILKEGIKAREKEQEKADERERERLGESLSGEIKVKELSFEGLEQRNKESADQQAADYAAAKKAQQEADIQLLNATVGIFSQLSSLAKEGSDEQKALALIGIAIDTAVALVAGIASSQDIPYPGNLIAMATTVATILANIAQAKSIISGGFAEGGWTGPGAKNEIKGVVHGDEYVTPKWQVNHPAARPHINALENMRVRGYADGGFVTNQAVSQTNNALITANALKNLPQPIVSVKEFTRVQNRVIAKENIAKL